MNSDHNKLLLKTAKAHFNGTGIIQKGTSRFFYRDNTISMIGIEFQPSSWSKGAYLNVGLCWLWRPAAHFTFDIGHREKEFAGAETATFEEIIGSYANHALLRTQQLEEEFRSLKTAKKYYLKAAEDAIPDQVNLLIIHGLEGDAKAVRKVLDRLNRGTSDIPWVRELQMFGKEMASVADSLEKFRAKVIETIITKRQALKLKNVLKKDEIHKSLQGFCR